VLRAAAETESTQANIRDWLELDGDPGFQLLTEEEIDTLPTVLHFSKVFLPFRAIFCFINSDDTPHPN
jgi:hypothetical protein